MDRLSEHAKVTILETSDIGGTTGNTAWLTMDEYERCMFYVELGTWNATDDLDTLKVQQYDGTTTKDLTTSASGGNYDTDSPLDADGNFAVIEVRAEDLDVDNGFNRIRCYVAETGNTGTDNVTIVAIQYGYSYPKAHLQGTETAGEQVYIDINS